MLLLKTIITTGGSLGRSRLARNTGGSRLVQTQARGCSLTSSQQQLTPQSELTEKTLDSTRQRGVLKHAEGVSFGTSGHRGYQVIRAATLHRYLTLLDGPNPSVKPTIKATDQPDALLPGNPRTNSPRPFLLVQ